jgi:transcriptional regulator GlxA family with amidase domain
MWLALTRSVGVAFGGTAMRNDDAWLNPGALQRAVEFVERRIDDDLSVATIANVVGLSTSAFLRAFRGSTGMTPGDYVLERRTALAADLLVRTTLTIAAIGRNAGFRSSNHFSTTFAARRGVSPSRFRRDFRLVY